MYKYSSILLIAAACLGCYGISYYNIPMKGTIKHFTVNRRYPDVGVYLPPGEKNNDFVCMIMHPSGKFATNIFVTNNSMVFQANSTHVEVNGPYSHIQPEPATEEAFLEEDLWQNLDDSDQEMDAAGIDSIQNSFFGNIDFNAMSQAREKIEQRFDDNH